MDDFRGYPHDLGNLYDLLWSVIHSCMCMQILLGRINTADSLGDSLLSTSAALRWVYFTLVGIQVTFRGSVLTHGKFTLLSFSYLCCSIVSVSTCFLHSIPIILDVRLFVFFFSSFCLSANFSTFGVGANPLPLVTQRCFQNFGALSIWCWSRQELWIDGTPMKTLVFLVFSVPHHCWDPPFYEILGETMWDPVQLFDCWPGLTRVILARLWRCKNIWSAIITAPSFWIRVSEYNRRVSKYNPDHAIALSYLHSSWQQFGCYFKISIVSIWSA